MANSKPINFSFLPLVRNRSQWDDEIVIYDELLPLIKLYQTSTPSLVNPLLASDEISGSSILKSSMRFDSVGIKSLGYNQNRSLPVSREDRYKFRLFTGFYSTIGFNKTEYENEKLESTRRRGWFSRPSQYDIFVLAVLKKPYRFNIQVDNNDIHTISVLPEDIILLVNSEKFSVNAKFIRNKYSLSVRRYTNDFLTSIKEEGLSEIRIVSDQYLSNFIKQGVKINTNSIMEVIEIQKRIIDNVFDNVKSHMLI